MLGRLNHERTFHDFVNLINLFGREEEEDINDLELFDFVEDWVGLIVVLLLLRARDLGGVMEGVDGEEEKVVVERGNVVLELLKEEEEEVMRKVLSSQAFFWELKKEVIWGRVRTRSKSIWARKARSILLISLSLIPHASATQSFIIPLSS